nr:hypothetical protein [Mycoplasmopsis bovis]
MSYAIEYKKFRKANPELVPYIDNNIFGVAPSQCNLPAYFSKIRFPNLNYAVKICLKMKKALLTRRR